MGRNGCGSSSSRTWLLTDKITWIMEGIGLLPQLLLLRSDEWSKPVWRIAVGVNRPGSGEGDGDIASPSSVRPASPRLAREAMGCAGFINYRSVHRTTTHAKQSHAHIKKQTKKLVSQETKLWWIKTKKHKNKKRKNRESVKARLIDSEKWEKSSRKMSESMITVDDFVVYRVQICNHFRLCPR